MLPLILIAVALALLIFLDIYIESQKKNKNTEEKNKQNANIKFKIVDKTIQDMYDILGTVSSSEDKIKKLNDILIKSFKPKYSSIVLYDGNKFCMKATNVEKEFLYAIENVAKENVFSSNVLKDVSKYSIAITDKNLSYKSAIERNIKSAIFSPIYFDKMFLGFWLIEDTKEHAFDGISNDDLAKFKHNLSLFIENIQVQSTIEIAENTDKQTGYYNNLYLYSNSRSLLISKDTSSVSLIYLSNLPEVNEKYSRNLGNTLLVKVTNAIKEIVSKESILVRYSGQRLLIITPGSNAQVAQPIMEKVLSKIKSEVEYIDDKRIGLDAKIVIHTLKKQNNIEKEIQNMVLFIDKMKADNTIKII